MQTKLNIFSPLTEQQEQIVLTQMDTSTKCPLCACGRTARKKVEMLLRETRTPDEIWRMLRADGYSPRLKHNDIETFTKAVEKHIVVCLRENVLEYDRALRDRRVNERLARELEKQAKSLGVNLEISSQQDSHINKMSGEPEIITKQQLKTEGAELLPGILLNSMRTLKLEQEKYLRGEIETPPDLKVLESVLRTLKFLIGSAGVADLLRDT